MKARCKACNQTRDNHNTGGFCPIIDKDGEFVVVNQEVDGFVRPTTLFTTSLFVLDVETIPEGAIVYHPDFLNFLKIIKRENHYSMRGLPLNTIYKYKIWNNRDNCWSASSERVQSRNLQGCELTNLVTKDLIRVIPFEPAYTNRLESVI